MQPLFYVIEVIVGANNLALQTMVLLLLCIVLLVCFSSDVPDVLSNLEEKFSDEMYSASEKAKSLVKQSLRWYYMTVVESEFKPVIHAISSKTGQNEDKDTAAAVEMSAHLVMSAFTKCKNRLQRLTQAGYVRYLWSTVGLSLDSLDYTPGYIFQLMPHKERVKDHFETAYSKFLLDWMNGDVTDRESSWNRMQSVVAQLKSVLGSEMTYRMERMANEVAAVRSRNHLESPHSATETSEITGELNGSVTDIQLEPYILTHTLGH